MHLSGFVVKSAPVNSELHKLTGREIKKKRESRNISSEMNVKKKQGEERGEKPEMSETVIRFLAHLGGKSCGAPVPAMLQLYSALFLGFLRYRLH